jgi:hypothetical protein
MMRRPKDMDHETWKAQRNAHWKRINRVWNVLMVLAILAVAARWLGWLPHWL